MKDIFDDIKGLVNQINFKNRPVHISYKYRTIYQVSRLTLIVGITSTIRGCSILKAQVISSALDNEEILRQLDILVNSGGAGFVRGWRYNQLISSAINYSNAEMLTEFSDTGKIVLTEKGRCFFDEIMADSELFSIEKNQLLKIKKKLSDAKLMTILERGM